MTKRKDEEFAKKAFNHFLISHVKGAVRWMPVRAVRPDYILDVDRKRYGVEVTRVRASMTFGDRSIPELSLETALNRFVKELEREAKSENSLRGLYHIDVTPFVDFKTVAKELRQLVRAFLSETMHIDRTGVVELWHGRRGQNWLIQKIQAEPDGLAESISIGDAKWEVDIINELRTLVAEAVERKREAAEKSPDDTILLLVDTYHYAGADLWASCIPYSEEAAFHTIARVFGNFECQVLHTNDGAWE